MYRYSNRLPWTFAQNSLARAVAERSGSFLDLTVSNPTTVFDYPHAAIREALHGIGDFAYQPDPFGLEPARAAVAEFYREQGFALDSSRIALTASTSEAYGLLFKLLCDCGDEVLIPSPSYPLFEYVAALEGVRTVPYRLEYDGSWFIDFDHLERQISPRSRAIVIVNPNNPTGSFLKNWEWQRLIDLALRHNLSIIADEVFMSFELKSSGGWVKTLVGDDAVLSFSLNGLSKSAGMPQMKLAWIGINGPVVERELARERLELILDTYLPVNTPVQLALRPLLVIGAQLRAAIGARTRENLARSRQILEDSPVHVLDTEGGWSAILQLPQTRTEEEWLLRLLNERDVLLQPGFFFDMPSEAYAVASLLMNLPNSKKAYGGLKSSLNTE